MTNSTTKREWKNDAERLGKKYRSTLHYVLAGLVPYTEANLKLSFKPASFFNDLDKLDYAKKHSVKMAYYRAVKKGLIEKDNENIPRLTAKGRQKLKEFKPIKLGKDSRLLLIFDIPETLRWKRDRLRLLLRELSFEQIQRSVWECKYDVRQYLQAEIREIGLHDYVVVYEAAEIKKLT